jgi:4a-hydroxytetrahydrobiopterin dehydratase
MNELKDLSVEWSNIDGEGLVRVVPTDSFRTGVQLVVKLAEIAEAQNHDPGVELTNDKVTITLVSHDVSDVTERDVAFARAVDELLGR